VKLDLGSLVPALKDWLLCVDECNNGCVICIQLPEWAKDFSGQEKILLALYLASRYLLEYRLVACMHIYSVRNRVVLRPEILVKALGEAKVVSKIPRAINDDNPYVWEAVFYKGILYAQQILDLDKPVVVRVEPPKDKREREKLRVLLEGKRVTINGKTYHVGGLVKKLGGERLSPWIYLLPKKNLPRLRRLLTHKIKDFTVLQNIAEQQ